MIEQTVADLYERAVRLGGGRTALTKGETALAPKGATGWGVMALNRMIRDGYEKG